MDKFTENLTGGVRRFAMAGVGAISLTIEKTKEIFDQLADRGETASAGSTAVCDELQKKMTEQLNAFTRTLRANYENASFEQLVAQCRRLTPEQQAELFRRMSEAPETGAEDETAAAGETVSGEAAAEEETGAQPCGCAPSSGPAADESAGQTHEEASAARPADREDSISAPSCESDPCSTDSPSPDAP